MKTMLFKCFLVFCLLFTLSKTTRAQPPGGPGGDFSPPEFAGKKPETPDEIAKRETRWMKRKLKLTDEQLVSVVDINFNNAFKKQELMGKLMNSGSRPTREQMMLSKKAFDFLAEEKDARLSKVLTEKQWTTYLSKKRQLEDNDQSMPSRPQGGRRGTGFPPPQ